jgi:hypothetical protein
MEALQMASKAKRDRQKLEREGKMNPELKRSPFSNNEMFRFMSEKKTGTKKDRLYKEKYKTSNF